MSSFEELHTELTDKEKQLFSETVNLLLARTYLVYERQEDRRHYRFVEKHLELFRRYLEIARWSIHLVKQYPQPLRAALYRPGSDSLSTCPA